MEIILKKDVENLGFKDEIVNVKNGYGRNFLIPQGFAVIATISAKKILAENLKQRAFKEKKIIEEASEKAKILSDLKIKIVSKVSTGDKLFGSISSENISAELQKNGIQIDKSTIKVAGKKIKKIGEHTVNIRLHRELTAPFTFEIIPDNKK